MKNKFPKTNSQRIDKDRSMSICLIWFKCLTYLIHHVLCIKVQDFHQLVFALIHISYVIYTYCGETFLCFEAQRIFKTQHQLPACVCRFSNLRSAAQLVSETVSQSTTDTTVRWIVQDCRPNAVCSGNKPKKKNHHGLKRNFVNFDQQS